MKRTRRTALGLLAGLFAATVGTVTFAAGTTVTVSLWDKGPAAQTMMNMMASMADADMMGMGMAGMANMPMAAVGITTDVTEVKAGEVTFAVTNDSKDIIHEMILAPVPASGILPYSPTDFRVDEEASGDLGEVSELEPGAAGALTLTLAPGDYILYCNLPGHYVMGMWTKITVTE